MKEKSKNAGASKRQLIAKANKAFFLWVVIASVAVSVTLVVGQFLVRDALFNNKVLGEKYSTESTLKQNIEVADELKQEVQKLVGDNNLAAVKAKPEDNNLKVVLDALPTTNEPLALGSSLQAVVLAKSGVVIEVLNTTDDSTFSVAPGQEEAVAVEEANEPAEIPFVFTVSGNVEQVKNALSDIERTIRPMKVTLVTFEGNDTQLKATVEAVAFYQAPKSLDLKKKQVRP